MTHHADKAVAWAARTWEQLPDDLARVGGAAILPIGATEQHGPHLYGWMVEDLTTLVRRGIAETPPLPHTYDERANPRTPL